MYVTYESHHIAGQEHWADDILTSISAERAGVIVSRSLTGDRDGFDAAVLAFHEQDPGTPGRFAALSSHLGSEPGPPRFLQLVQFTGARSTEWVEALRRAGEERIWPAVRNMPGFVEVLNLVAEDGTVLTISLASTAEALVEGARRILATTLLPWEDPAMLTGPDRYDTHVVVHAEMPQSIGVSR